MAGHRWVHRGRALAIAADLANRSLPYEKNEPTSTYVALQPRSIEPKVEMPLPNSMSNSA